MRLYVGDYVGDSMLIADVITVVTNDSLANVGYQPSVSTKGKSSIV